MGPIRYYQLNGAMVPCWIRTTTPTTTTPRPTTTAPTTTIITTTEATTTEATTTGNSFKVVPFQLGLITMLN